MLIIPAVDIKDGKCVQLVQGEPGTEQVIIENPHEVAMDWEKRGAEMIHLIDLDGAFGDKEKNINVIKKVLTSVNVPVQMGGGIRTKKDASRLLEMGVHRVILGTMAIENPEDVKEISDEYGNERIIVALDSKDSKVVVKGWTEKTSKSAPEWGKIFEKNGAGGILFTNVDYEGLLEGFDVKPLMELLDAVNIPIIYSGGVTSINDIKKLSKTDVHGVVVGSAIYKGKINFEDALKI
ncbi:1-(5-phosphoribosyl)-5-[(5-phosphoribosylamino)methylideneamino]imidazole-4-carboxamide isomerase [Methanobacterium sp. ACI-7]|uniref:1-(5-phosphoribosyl)-5-[(5- phosphoribosylamino)methylideneamino]imidazole-4- carboxamide isomerase n=1 Tax=unclassified Methanobacterium TaxID=2627676 RepID=UPI0039C1A3D8